AEGQLLSCFKSLIQSNEAFQEAHWWLHFEEADFERADARPGLNTSPGELFARTLKTSEELGFTALSKRQLLNRAFAFGVRNSLSDVLHGNLAPDEEPLTLKFFKWVRANSAKFHSQVIAEFTKISALLEQTSPEAIINSIVIDVPNHRRVQQGQQSVFFDRPAMLPLRWTLPLDQIVQYYENRSLAYIFAPREICALVGLAAERIVWEWEEAGLLYVQDEGLSEAVVRETAKRRADLAKRGYYDTCLQLKPASLYLQSFAAQEQIDRIVNNLLRFRSWRGQRITAALVRAFTIQFPEQLHEPVLSLLEHLAMIEPSEIAAAVIQEYKEACAAGSEVVGVVPVGNLTDSATHLLYELKNHPDKDVRELGPRITALQAATIQGSDRLLFFDDNTNSGLQVLNVFADWLGIDLPENVNLGEKHVDELPQRAQDKLRRMKISFVFGVSPEGAETRIQTLFQEHLQIPIENVTVRVGRVLTKTRRLLSGDNPPVDIPKRSELRSFLDQVGREIMESEGKTPEKAEQRSMGEDRTEAMVVFPYNTPTMTITALWCRGSYSKGSWMPLIERRRNVRAGGTLGGEDA
ncbi:MAG: metal dependent phosphohydrolase, partial [Verrucomicrobiales bacterium]|nr:metal dependent phosphohydrolase [Verrucomicrobiales bacterium]